jgi:uncharacterized protein YdeI (YjbR/CyaY-like superfamily)
MARPKDDLPVLSFPSQAEWEAWLHKHHADSPGLWLRLAKTASGTPSVSYAEAVEGALCHGWIDGQKNSLDDTSWLQKFTPRGPRSLWAKLNRERAERLIAEGRMTPAGLAAVEAARRDGRWKAAYDSPKTSAVPDDFQAALARNAKAKAFFATIDGRNRYAMLWRIQTAKKAETRERRIQDFVQMLAKKQLLYPAARR